MNTTTGERLALVTRLEGAVAVSSGADFDPEEWFRGVLSRDTGPDATAHTTLPALPPPSWWPFLTRA